MWELQRPMLRRTTDGALWPVFYNGDTLRRNVAFGLTNEQIEDTAVQRAIMRQVLAAA